MRIAVMLRTFDEKGGIAVYSRNLVETLLDIDDRNEYLFLYRSDAHVGRFGSRANVTEQVIHGRSKALWDQVSVARACRREKADVVFHPKFTVPLLTPVPSVMVVHGADWYLPGAAKFYTRMDRAYIRAFMPLYLRRAAAVISVSELTTRDFQHYFPALRDKFRTVYFGPARHFGRVTDPSHLARVRKRYGLPDHFILTLTKIGGGERKNFRGILAGYERLSGRVPHALVVGGQGCERFRDDYDIPEEGWGRRVQFPGYIDQADLPAVYSMADLFLYPSNQEAFPIPITEAMTCGTPIVSSSANGLEELAGDAALLVDPADPSAIADAVCKVLLEGDVRARLASAGLERAGRFSWISCAKKTLEILHEVVDGCSPGNLAAKSHA